MNQIFFLNLLPAKSFLTEKLLVKNYDQLRVGKKTYLEMIWTSLALDPVNFQYHLVPANQIDQALIQLPEFKTLALDDYLVVWNLNFLPLVSAQIKKILEKLFVAKQPVLAKTQSGQIILWGATKAEITTNQPSSIPVEIQLKNLVSDLSLPEVSQAILASGLETRVFNSLKTSQFVFTKLSHQTQKIQAEYNFLSHLPAEIRQFYPQVLDLNLNGSQASYELERIFAFDVATLIKNQTIFQNEALGQLFDRLADYRQRLPQKRVSQSVYRAKLTDLFVTKLADRVKTLRTAKIWPKLNQICQFQGFGDLADFHHHLATQLKAQIAQTQESDLEFSHGDLSACNLLYDLQTQQLKLVDPRGWEKSDIETWRPVEYDLAKLSHSFSGGYDLINADLAKLVMTPTGIKTEFLLAKHQRTLLQAEFDKFLQATPFNLTQLKLYEASLFLSLIPLHLDHPDRNLLQLNQAVTAYLQATTST